MTGMLVGLVRLLGFLHPLDSSGRNNPFCRSVRFYHSSILPAAYQCQLGLADALLVALFAV